MSEPPPVTSCEPAVGAQRAATLLSLVLLYIASLVVMGPTLRLSQWYVSPENNQSAAEAMAWLNGSLDLKQRGGDVAEYQGRYYNIFPPLWTIVCFVVYGFNQWWYGEPLVILTPVYVGILAGPLPALVYLAFRRSGAGVYWAAVLALAAMAGTCLWPVATLCHRGWIYSIQHAASQAGLAILLIDVLGRQRLWLAGVGVAVAAWSRPLCVLYALPVLYVAAVGPDRRRRLLLAAAPLIVTVSVPMILNWLKFGSPLETGYQYLYAGLGPGASEAFQRDDGTYAIFSLRYVRDHAYHMWVAPPRLAWTVNGLSISGAGAGTALYYGTPLVLFVLACAARWWKDAARRALMLTTLPVIALLLAYFGPGYGTPGYYRYTLDFTLVWLVVVAPWTQGRRARCWALACIAWSLLYFYLIATPDAPPGMPKPASRTVAREAHASQISPGVRRLPGATLIRPAARAIMPWRIPTPGRDARKEVVCHERSIRSPIGRLSRRHAPLPEDGPGDGARDHPPLLRQRQARVPRPAQATPP